MNKTLKAIADEAKNLNQLFSVLWEITDRCNFECRHCFICERAHFISVEDVKYILDELKQAGVLLITLTGGEPLLHPNFIEIYTLIKKAGMLVTLFSNGSLFTENIISILCQLPPASIEISLYGHNESSYAEFTKTNGKHKKIITTLKKLKEAGLNVILKTTLIAGQEHMLDYIQQLASELGCDYRYGSIIQPKLDGSNDHLKLRMSPADTAKTICKQDARLAIWKEKVIKKGFGITENLRCTAGISSLVINSNKSLSFCALLSEPAFKFYDQDTFQQAVGEIRGLRKEMEDNYKNCKCSKCVLSTLCKGCPASSILENNNPYDCMVYSKEILLEKLQLANISIPE